MKIITSFSIIIALFFICPFSGCEFLDDRGNPHDPMSNNYSDDIPPSPGNHGTITAGSITASSLVLSWSAGTDNKTAALDLQYAVYKSANNNISSVDDCENNGTLIDNYTANITTKNVTDLAANTTYYFNVVIKDSAGNKAVYNTKYQATSAIIDSIAPVPGGSGSISAGSVSYNSLTLNWTAGTDNITAVLDLQYAVYQSVSNNISTVADCEANGTLIQDYTANLLAKNVISLSGSTPYYFNVVIKDSAGNKAVYTTRQQTTAAEPDTTAPVPGGSGTISAGSVSYNSLVLSWTAGTDNVTIQGDLQYAVYQTTSSSIGTIAEWEASTLIQNYTANITTINVTGLTASTTYYFNVVIKDSAGNKALYTKKQQATTATPDTTSPVAGNSGTITAGSVSTNSLVLSWTAGSDNVTAQGDLQYAVYQSTSNNIDTVANCKANGTLIQAYTANLLTKSVTGLTASTPYYFNVLIKDAAGNEACYAMKQQTTATPDTTAPVPGNSGTITTGSVTVNSLILSWTAGTDNVTASASLQYAVYQSASNNLGTVANCKANGSLIQAYTVNLTSKTVTGLTTLTTYYFNVLIKDAAGNEAVYTTKAQTTIGLPTVTTASISGIHATSAAGGGNVTSDGGTAVTARGICWNTGGSPTTGSSKTSDGTGTGSFTSSMTSLTLHTTYYVRAYATNSVGTSYGTQVSFEAHYALRDVGPAGGWIFYDKGSYSGSPSWRYLEATPTDLSTGRVWGTMSTNLSGADGVAVGTGYQNTMDIFNNDPTTDNAARTCLDYYNVYNTITWNDWFLPSKDELGLMFTNLKAYGVGNFADSYFWNSTEADANNANGQYMYDTGLQYSDTKSNANYVRGARWF